MKSMIAITAGLALATSTLAQPKVPSPSARIFTNPIAPHGQDPWVVQAGGYYWYCRAVSGGKIQVSRTRDLPLIDEAPKSIVWTPPAEGPYSRDVWAPELHCIAGHWYIYFAADDGSNANHRMYVLEGTSRNPQDDFVFRGQVVDQTTDKWAIDGTVLDISIDGAGHVAPGDGSHLYFVWSGWPGDVNVQQNLYIAPMSDPLTISGPRTLISEPDHEWERHGTPYVNEGPEQLIHDGKLFIIYSASGSWTDDYCLGQLSFTGTNLADITSHDSWAKYPEPVFGKTDQVFGPGHASFVQSDRGSMNWIVYHAARFSGAGWDRDVRTQPFTWDDQTGMPNFGDPVAPGVPVHWVR